MPLDPDHRAQNAKAMRPERRSNPLVIGTTILLLIIAATNLVFLVSLREASLETAEANLARYSLTLAEQVDSSFKSLDLVLSSVGDYIGRREVTDAASYRLQMSDNETFRFLKEKITGLPQVDAVTMIDADGKLLNFSRYWPIPDVNVADRDYFQALKADPTLETFIGKPVQNRGDGGWVIYLARRLNDPNGDFMGLILGAVSMRYFENFFGATSLGGNSSASLFREDGVLLARFPESTQIGQPGHGTAQRVLAAGGILREAGGKDHQNYIQSARTLANYPLTILARQSFESVLTGWHGMALQVLIMSAICAAAVLVAAFLAGRLWREQRRAALIAQASNAAKSSFLAVMSHEIRTPMNAVLGLSSTLLEGRVDEEQRRSLLTIRESGEHLLELLNDILDFSKLEAGQMTLEAIPFPPAALVHNTVSIFLPRATAKGVNVRAVEDAAVPAAVVGDAGRIRQTLFNLASNAVKFTESGEVLVAVRCLERKDASAVVEWSVSDTGIGIPAERIKDLFADFVQADSSISRRFGGSGLGLAICKRLIQRMGGDIDVVSVPGRGSTFRFALELPLAETLSPVHRDEADVFTRFAARTVALGRPLRILIVDDDPSNRLVATQMLKQFAVAATTACDGAEAVETASKFAFDLILMDMRMPRMDGLQATRARRMRGGRLAAVPIIAFTANAFADDVAACRDAGMDDFIAKPVRKRDLVATILQALDRAPPEGPLEEPEVAAPPLAPENPTSEQTDHEPRGATSADLAAADADNAPSFDRAVFDMLVADIDAEPAFGMLDMFLAETDARLVRLHGLEGMSDRALIERDAHSLKGSAATFGFMRLSRLAKALQFAAPTIDEGGYRALLARIAAEFALARPQAPARTTAAAT